MGNRRKQYRGRLNPRQAAEGIRVAWENARDLLSEAKELFEIGHHARATSLAILSIEESGKPGIIREILLASTDKELKIAWRNYRRHTSKNMMWILPQLIGQGARAVDDFRSIWDEQSDHTKFIETVKQISLYSDAYNECNWSNPHEVIEPHFAKQMIEIAEILVGKGPSAMTTEPELEIWLKHMQPIWGKASLEELKEAFYNSYREAQEKGVLSSTRGIDDLDVFVNL